MQYFSGAILLKNNSHQCTAGIIVSKIRISVKHPNLTGGFAYRFGFMSCVRIYVLFCLVFITGLASSCLNSTAESTQKELRAPVPEEMPVKESDSIDARGRAMLEKDGYYEITDTELGELYVGNFDFRFDGKKVDINVRVKFKFDDSLSDTQQKRFKEKFFNGIDAYWTSAGVSFVREKGDCYGKKIPLFITCSESNSNYHKIVDVRKASMRCHVMREMNLCYAVDERGIAHEFGHVLGLYDSYDGGVLENSMLWHDNRYLYDTGALMARGTEMRKRYFNHILRKLNALAAPDCKYRVEASFE